VVVVVVVVAGMDKAVALAAVATRATN